MQLLALWLRSNLRWLTRQLMLYGRTREEAEDLIQEAYLRVHRYCEQGNDAREPEKVLVRTVMRLSMNQSRDSRVHQYVSQPVEELALIDPRPPTDEALNAQETLQKVIRLLDSIEPRSREAFLLHRVDGLTYVQIARQMGVSVSSVEKHIAWAMAVLMDSVDRSETPP